MAGRAVRERLTEELGGWLTDGLISKEAHDLLRQRYGAERFGVAQAIKYLGISGGLLAFFGLLGFVAAVTESTGVAAFLLAAVGAGLVFAGIRLFRDKLGRYGASSKVVLALGVVSSLLGMGLAISCFDIKDTNVVRLTGALALPPIFWLAYRFRNIFLLILGLLVFFHWTGSWTTMSGRSTYGIFIDDTVLASLASLAAVVVGIFHEVRLRLQTGRFFQAYEALGLFYLNMCLLILSLDGKGTGSQTAWAIAMAVAAIVQLVCGARLHSGLFTGFGVTSLAVNLYTRYYERFWDRMHEGLFFLCGGLALLGAGVACELSLKQLRSQRT